MCFRSETEKVNTATEFCIFELIYVLNFSINWHFWFFGPNLPKKCFWSKSQKREHRHWMLHIRISLGTKFQLKLTVLIFWTKFAQKVNIMIEFCIFEIVYVPNFSLNWQVGFFWPNLPKKCVSGLNRKSEHDHWILHVRISLGTKFQLKLTILIFWTKV